MFVLNGCVYMQTKEATYVSFLKDIRVEKTTALDGTETIKASGKQSPNAIDAAAPVISAMAMYIFMGM